jgi:galactokinase
MALAQETLVLAAPREHKSLRIFAADLDRSVTVSLDRLEWQPDDPWADYVIGVVLERAKLGFKPLGADVFITGDLPKGAGLSSSASLEMAVLALLEALDGKALDGPEAALLGQRVENEFLGINSGIMDQFAVRLCRAGHALFLDCRSNEYKHVPVTLPDAVFVVAHTGVERGLDGSKYNERVDECAEAVRELSQLTGRVGTHLRDFDGEQVAEHWPVLPDVARRRARHVCGENERTRQTCAALEAGDAGSLGALMNASDHSLREDYAVTCAELDAMTACARAIEGCYGSRMTGAGFGGCTVSLVERDQVAAFVDALTRAYERETGLATTIIVTEPADGACALSLPPS